MLKKHVRPQTFRIASRKFVFLASARYYHEYVSSPAFVVLHREFVNLPAIEVEDFNSLFNDGTIHVSDSPN